MSQDPFRYDRWIEDALRGVVRRALETVAEQGLWGGHHFYITFETDAPGVEIPDALRAQYADEMTIVLQHEFWDLEVTPEAFEVTLSFANQRSRLRVPLGAVTAFADPSVKFGLQLRMEGLPGTAGGGDEPAAPEDEAAAEAAAEPQDAGDEGDGESRTGEVIALDAFRKK